MCGLVGFLGGSIETVGDDALRQGSGQALRQGSGHALLRRMADTLYHRRPDDGGYWSDSEQRTGLGHRRLAIVDLSPAGHQPMTSESARYVIRMAQEE